jgi:hypothetical protein
MKYDATKIFDLLTDESYYGLNFKITLMGLDNRDLDTICGFINKCRLGRKLDVLPYKDFLDNPELVLSWEEWHSGGGCMIWIHEFCDGMSIFVTDEVIQLSKFNSAHTLDAEFGENDEVDYWLLTHYLTEDHDEPLSFYLCPFLGQELADLVAKDIHEIVRCF